MLAAAATVRRVLATKHGMAPNEESRTLPAALLVGRGMEDVAWPCTEMLVAVGLENAVAAYKEADSNVLHEDVEGAG